jgi:hypothetical protein
MSEITKFDYVYELLESIVSQATRKLRGTDEQKYLIRDLDAIAEEAKKAQRIMRSDKLTYTHREIKLADFKEFQEAVEKAVKK